MSRTSRKNNSIVENGQKVYRAAGYIRLSVVKDSQDRDSIENQKSIIQAYIEKKGDIALQQFYVDTNATGTSFERNALQQMMEDISSGVAPGMRIPLVNVFNIVKDGIQK